jgi:hypothetical protein
MMAMSGAVAFAVWFLVIHAPGYTPPAMASRPTRPLSLDRLVPEGGWTDRTISTFSRDIG